MKERLEKELLSDNDDYKLDTLNDCYLSNKTQKILFALSTENVKKVEFMLCYNPDYPQFINYNDLDNEEMKLKINKAFEEIKNPNKTTYKYPSTYYILAFKDESSKKIIEDNLYKTFINVILKKINSENHTRASNSEIKEISEKICNEFKSSDELVKDALIDNKEYKLMKCIIEKTSKNRHNFSLATKFCHYMNLILYFNTKYANLFSIYDRVVQDNLVYYYNYYVSNPKDDAKNPIKNGEYKYYPGKLKEDEKTCNKILEIYRNYQSIIDMILEKTEISRNGFDHLVWYTGKNN